MAHAGRSGARARDRGHNSRIRQSLFILLGVAVLALTVDLGQKALAIADHGDDLLYHERSLAYVAGITFAAIAWCAGLVATRSPGLALAGGLLLGGAAGNAVSGLLWPSYEGTPNPFFVGDEVLGLAFNLADVFVVVAVFVVLPIALALFVLRNRHRLRERVSLRG